MQSVDVPDFGIGLFLGCIIGYSICLLVDFLDKWNVTLTRKDKK